MAQHRNAALAKLLGSLFDSDELRWHLANEPCGDMIPDALPGTAVSHHGLARSAVDLLLRHGFVDREFFDRLVEVRARRAAEIRKVRTLWLRGAELERDALWGEERYRLVELLGCGGFGQVWKAVDTRTGRVVALKVLLEHHADDRTIRRRFYRGAAVLAELSHPAIVRILSGVEQEGVRHYYAMEYIDGESLDALVPHRPFLELLDVVLQIGEGLAFIHARGLLHRDVKPHNIIVTRRGQARLIDFDLVAGDAFDPMTTRTIGTRFFSPPEGFQTVAKSAAYDVFGLARTVEYLLRGGVSTDSDPAASDTLDAPESVRSLLHSALCPDPALRIRSVETFCAALRAAYARPAATLPVIDDPTYQLIATPSLPNGITLRWRSAPVAVMLASVLTFSAWVSMGTPPSAESDTVSTASPVDAPKSIHLTTTNISAPLTGPTPTQMIPVTELVASSVGPEELTQRKNEPTVRFAERELGTVVIENDEQTESSGATMTRTQSRPRLKFEQEDHDRRATTQRREKLEEADMQAVLIGATNAAKACGKQLNTLMSEAAVTVKVNGDGKVEDVAVEPPARGTPEAACIVAEVSKLSFARSQEGGEATWKLKLY